jgi:RNA-directed DNA polymerase
VQFELTVPTVLDRFIQQAVMQVLQRRWNPTFSLYSYGFRPRRSAHQAVAQAQQYIAQGHGWVIDLDLEKFFDRVNHDKLMGQIAKRIEDKRLLKLIRAFLNAGVMENGLVSPSVEGTPQGGPLSPLLSNLVLDELDRELENRGHRFVRYADDCNIYVRSERAGQRVMESISRFITQKLKLKVNEAKSAVARPQERKFLGFSFTAGPDIKRTIAPKSLDRFKQRIRDITRRAKGVSIKTIMEELAPYMRGWRGYFGFCQTPEVLVALTRWVRLRLRAALWRQWKTPRRRRAALIALGVRGELRNMPAAAMDPGISPGAKPSRWDSPMPTSNRSVSHPCSARVSAASRTAVYGPVRTVVWEGWSREAPPYPDLWPITSDSQLGPCPQLVA